MIPDNLNPENYVHLLNEFIDHGKQIEPSTNIPKHHITQDIYYYLADYYFKNNDLNKAIEFYIRDLTLNRDRFNSWVGCALVLIKFSDEYFCSNGRVFYSSTDEVLLLGEKVLRCFNEAVRLKKSESKVWFEYGKFAYYISSYISRVMKFGPALENSQKEEMKKQRKRFLDRARDCFESAINSGDCDTIWMNYYFLGKIAERSNILQALRYYELFKFHMTSIEHSRSRFGIEIHYRIHACVLKYIYRHKTLPARVLSQMLVFLSRAKKGKTFGGFVPSDELEIENEVIEGAEEVKPDLVSMEIKSRQLFMEIVQMCLEAMHRNLQCTQSCSHYKSLYRMAYHYFLSNDPRFARKILTESFELPARFPSSILDEESSTDTVNFFTISGLFPLINIILHSMES
ncbi:calcineurin-binding protein cabin-1-like [Panonychus citri]|uniref:calcineurin-binding protein cabin-1-like n=1 Tax=Panonychus citri TaxID=50023 RepID=UPI0023082A8B|nr:calcineurin-binding protein cabin-1-like [Panonychus citri]